MQDTLQLGTYIIDLTEAMLEHGHRLNAVQCQQIESIRNCAVHFLTGYLQHENSALDALLHYLQAESLRPVQAIIRATEMLTSGMYGGMPKPFVEALQEIQACSYDIQEDIIAMEANLLAFVQRMEQT